METSWLQNVFVIDYQENDRSAVKIREHRQNTTIRSGTALPLVFVTHMREYGDSLYFCRRSSLLTLWMLQPHCIIGTNQYRLFATLIGLYKHVRLETRKGNAKYLLRALTKNVIITQIAPMHKCTVMIHQMVVCNLECNYIFFYLQTKISNFYGPPLHQVRRYPRETRLTNRLVIFQSSVFTCVQFLSAVFDSFPFVRLRT